MGWSDLEWVGVHWIALEWPGMSWIGLEWVGVAWNGLEWVGVAWSGLEWVGAQFDKADIKCNLDTNRINSNYKNFLWTIWYLFICLFSVPYHCVYLIFNSRNLRETNENQYFATTSTLHKLVRGKLHGSILLEFDLTDMWLSSGNNALNMQAYEMVLNSHLKYC